MECYLLAKENDPLAQAMTWMNLENMLGHSLVGKGSKCGSTIMIQ